MPRKRATIEGKGVLNNRLSEFFMNGLTNIGIPNHFIRRINMREQLIRQVEIIPLEVIVRNFAAGSMSKRLGMEEGTALPRPIVEYSYKNDALGDPMVSARNTSSPSAGPASRTWTTSSPSRLRVNDFLAGVFFGVGIKLVDFKIEIGRIWDGDFMRLIVADEISPDSAAGFGISRPARSSTRTCSAAISAILPMPIARSRVASVCCRPRPRI